MRLSDEYFWNKHEAFTEVKKYLHGVYISTLHTVNAMI